jgi:methionine salvage enolase-phosphatase E1
MLFVSDVLAEVDAARTAGMQALLIAREGSGDVRNLGEVLP